MILSYHNPVLLSESLRLLNLRPDGVYIDATFGGGGHSVGILAELGSSGRLYAFDQDPDAKQNLPEDSRLTFVASNFGLLADYIKFYQIQEIDGVLADLGVSSHQFDTAERGFSIRHEGPLDMRMNPNNNLTAADVLNNYTEDRLAGIFWQYSEISQSKKLASAIEAKRKLSSFSTISDLIDVASRFCRSLDRNQFLSRVFQALRMEVNQEILALKQLLSVSASVLSPGGRIVVISYHSGEDRLVKNFFNSGNFEGRLDKDLYGNIQRPLNPILRKPIIPDEQEIRKNPRARSAKLRVAEKTRIV